MKKREPSFVHDQVEVARKEKPEDAQPVKQVPNTDQVSKGRKQVSKKEVEPKEEE